jgi:hypothetical protein
VDPQNLAYALVQVVHNFGAVAVSAGGAAGYLLQRFGLPPPRRLGWLVFAGWIAQAASGAGFGTVSLLAYGQLPDLHDIAAVALGLKVLCATAGFVLTALWLRLGTGWTVARRRAVWAGLAGLAALALTAAAFLRWFA